jgi:hypothetical protein
LKKKILKFSRESEDGDGAVNLRTAAAHNHPVLPVMERVLGQSAEEGNWDGGQNA